MKRAISRLPPSLRAQLLGDERAETADALLLLLSLSPRQVLLAQKALFTPRDSPSGRLADTALINECSFARDHDFYTAARMRANHARLVAMAMGVRPHRSRAWSRDERLAALTGEL